MFALAAAQTAAKTTEKGDWWTDHSTLIVGLTGIIVSGFVGPTVVALWTAKRERDRDKRALIVARRDDLRDLLDEAAKVLAGAVPNLRPLLEAASNGRPLPKEPKEFLGGLVPLGERLRLRLPDDHAVVERYDAASTALQSLQDATGSQSDWDAAVGIFETERSKFLAAGRAAVRAPVDEKKAI